MIWQAWPGIRERVLLKTAGKVRARRLKSAGVLAPLRPLSWNRFTSICTSRIDMSANLSMPFESLGIVINSAQNSGSRQSESYWPSFFLGSPHGKSNQNKFPKPDLCKTCCGEIYWSEVAFAGPLTCNEDEWLCWCWIWETATNDAYAHVHNECCYEMIADSATYHVPSPSYMRKDGGFRCIPHTGPGSSWPTGQRSIPTISWPECAS